MAEAGDLAAKGYVENEFFLSGTLLRAGYAWGGVSTQKVGIDAPLGLRAWDSARYGGLTHPGDAYSYDIFSQAA
jgi:hypothetical protein